MRNTHNLSGTIFVHSLIFKCTQRLSGINFTRDAQIRKIGKQNDVKVFKINKTKGSKQDSHNRLNFDNKYI